LHRISIMLLIDDDLESATEANQEATQAVLQIGPSVLGKLWNDVQLFGAYLTLPGQQELEQERTASSAAKVNGLDSSAEAEPGPGPRHRTGLRSTLRDPRRGLDLLSRVGAGGWCPPSERVKAQVLAAHSHPTIDFVEMAALTPKTFQKRYIDANRPAVLYSQEGTIDGWTARRFTFHRFHRVALHCLRYVCSFVGFFVTFGSFEDCDLAPRHRTYALLRPLIPFLCGAAGIRCHGWVEQA
jgi:hypothetical protein